MFVNLLILANNPFFEAYTHSDFLGKLIFIGLIILSVGSWIVLLHRFWLNARAHRNSLHFYEAFQLHKVNPLSLECDNLFRKKLPNPFLELYLTTKKHTLDILSKNRHFGLTHQDEHRKESAYLLPEDIDFVAAHVATAIASQTKQLEKNLYILSTTVSLAPFLGLLGTVWGILTTFSALQAQGMGSTHELVLGGLSLALATTVLGLIDAIPALIGYNYLKNSVRDFSTEMEGFSNEVLASVELQYRKVH